MQTARSDRLYRMAPRDCKVSLGCHLKAPVGLLEPLRIIEFLAGIGTMSASCNSLSCQFGRSVAARGSWQFEILATVRQSFEV